MTADMNTAFKAGYERLSAWADLLDQINVFPVADADTGRNLIISLAPLRDLNGDTNKITRRLLMSATGNSGNIANCFFSDFITGNPSKDMLSAAKAGRDRAWGAIVDPKPGTMLAVLNTLVDQLEKPGANQGTTFFLSLIKELQRTVHATADILPTLKAAGVVDSGALGIYIFLEGFFARLAEQPDSLRPVTETFDGKLSISPSFQGDTDAGFCVDTVIRTTEDTGSSLDVLSAIGNSIVIRRDNEDLKIHLHTRHRENAREALEKLGHVVQWSDEIIRAKDNPPTYPHLKQTVRIVTDAAGSITRQQALKLGISLFDSYIVKAKQSVPETAISPADLYRSMQKGEKVTTAQASVFERRQRYHSIVNRYGHALYLCVGSVYTGNYHAVIDWKQRHDPENRLQVIDTGSASGRLGILALAVAKFANHGNDMARIVEFAQAAKAQSEEYLFLDRLKYLVAGGRISKSKGFMGDMLNIKPIISPTEEGAVKAGTARNRRQQIDFAMEKIKTAYERTDRLSIMLEYSDNRHWVEDSVLKKIKHRYPFAEVILQPLSLTSGVHMGPGTWGVALLPLIQLS